MNKVKNMCNSTIAINLPNVPLKFELKPKQERSLTNEALMELNYDTGCANMVKWGFLQIKYDDTAADYGIEPIEITQKTAADVNVEDLLTNKGPKELAEALKNATPALKDDIVAKAVALSIADPGRCNIIEKYTGVKILDVIAMARKE